MLTYAAWALAVGLGWLWLREKAARRTAEQDADWVRALMARRDGMTGSKRRAVDEW